MLQRHISYYLIIVQLCNLITNIDAIQIFIFISIEVAAHVHRAEMKYFCNKMHTRFLL